MHMGLISKKLYVFVVPLMYGALICYNLVDAWGQHLINFWHFWGFVNAWGFDLLKFIYLFCDYVDVQGQEFFFKSDFWGSRYWCVGATTHNFMTFVVVLMCGSFQCWLISYGYVKLFILCGYVDMGKN